MKSVKVFWEVDMRKSLILFFAGLFVLIVGFNSGVFAAGEHKGEAQMLDVDIQFSGARGYTVTNADGIFYHFYGIVAKENKIYPEKYWGSVPLYFFGQTIPVTVVVTNKGPRAKAKIKVVSESYCLMTDGSNGAALMKPKIVEVEIARGETKTIDASFNCEYTPEADSGLDRFTVKVLHINSGGGPGNEEPALIMSREGIFCPPEYIPGK